MIIASFLVILGLFQHKHLRLIGGEFFLFVFICRNPSFSSYNLIETKVSLTTFMLYKPLCAFSHIPGVCGGTFSSPTGGFALPFAAAASCCAISLWVRSLRRLKHSRDIAVQLCGCPPGSAHKEQGLTQLLLPASVVTVPLCSQQELHCLSATQLLKCHRAFPLWQLVCTERNMKTWTDSVDNSKKTSAKPAKQARNTSSSAHQIWNHWTAKMNKYQWQWQQSFEAVQTLQFLIRCYKTFLRLLSGFNCPLLPDLNIAKGLCINWSYSHCLLSQLQWWLCIVPDFPPLTPQHSASTHIC